MSDSRYELADGADPIKALLLVVGALGCIAGTALCVAGISQTVEFGWKTFWSAHGGGFQFLAGGAQLLGGGIVALVIGLKRKRNSGK